MKKASEIIHNIVQSPPFKPLKRQISIQRFIQVSLPLSLRQAILFAYEKEGNLLIALHHPAFLKEFNYRLPLIKSLLRKAQEEGLEGLEGIKDIRVFISRKALIEETPPASPLRYSEHSQGVFENLALDEDIHRLFEEIRAVILQNRRREAVVGEEGFWARQLS